MEFFAARKIGDTARKAAQAADAHDIFPSARRGFCRPLRAPDPSPAAQWIFGSCRPVHLYGICARRCAELLSALATKFISLRAGSGHHLLFSRASRRGCQPDHERPSEIEVLRSGDGLETFARPR